MSNHPGTTPEETEPKVPPVTVLGMVSLALVVAGGIYLASNFPHHFSIAPAVALLAASAVILGVNLLLLSRVEAFAWRRFRTVTGWALLAYVVIAGMIEYVFVLDHTRGTVLVVTTLMLGVFGLNPPLILGFTVARYEDLGDRQLVSPQ